MWRTSGIAKKICLSEMDAAANNQINRTHFKRASIADTWSCLLMRVKFHSLERVIVMTNYDDITFG